MNETKLGILAVMQALGRATTSQELQLIWGGQRKPAVFDYHLSTLVRAGIAELLTNGPELGFRLVDGARLTRQSRPQKAGPPALAEEKRS